MAWILVFQVNFQKIGDILPHPAGSWFLTGQFTLQIRENTRVAPVAHLLHQARTDPVVLSHRGKYLFAKHHRRLKPGNECAGARPAGHQTSGWRRLCRACLPDPEKPRQTNKVSVRLGVWLAGWMQIDRPILPEGNDEFSRFLRLHPQ